MTKNELKIVFDSHKLWLSGDGGLHADLRHADLRHADLSDANLSDANLRHADLSDANLSDTVKNIVPYNQNCPEEGDFIGWKKVSGDYVLKLLICGDRASPVVGRKCRTNKCKVIAAYNLDGSSAEQTEFKSNYDENFVYKIGEIVIENNYNPDFTVECSTGIHFFITKQEALDY